MFKLLVILFIIKKNYNFTIDNQIDDLNTSEIGETAHVKDIFFITI